MSAVSSPPRRVPLGSTYYFNNTGSGQVIIIPSASNTNGIEITSLSAHQAAEFQCFGKLTYCLVLAGTENSIGYVSLPIYLPPGTGLRSENTGGASTLSVTYEVY